MLVGHQSWQFQNAPVIIGAAAVVGPFEGAGPLARDFDLIHDDLWLGQDSFEKAEKKLLEEACERALDRAGVRKEDVSFFLAGDLMNQVISSSFCARTLAIPYLGMYGACSTAMEALALGAFLVNAGGAERILCATSSHNAAAEKQYRYPTEYGAQKPPTAQWTVTGAGAAVVAPTGSGPVIEAATIGRVVDMGISDPFNMGAAMAPAAVDTITAHFRDFDRSFADYDLVVTGDLGRIGHQIAADLLDKHGLKPENSRFADCGVLIFGEDQPVLAGGSGCGCSAAVTYGHLLKRIQSGELKRVLVVATGALHSPISYQQNETIPGIAHAVSIASP
ncbi:MAG: stage V sporulation protein AD [Solirubrobacterales bacterium]